MHVLKGHSERVTGVARLDGSRLVSCSSDSSLRVWDLKTGKVLHELGLPSPANCLGAAGQFIVVADPVSGMRSAPLDVPYCLRSAVSMSRVLFSSPRLYRGNRWRGRGGGVLSVTSIAILGDKALNGWRQATRRGWQQTKIYSS